MENRNQQKRISQSGSPPKQVPHTMVPPFAVSVKASPQARPDQTVEDLVAAVNAVRFPTKGERYMQRSRSTIFDEVDNETDVDNMFSVKGTKNTSIPRHRDRVLAFPKGCMGIMEKEETSEMCNADNDPHPETQETELQNADLINQEELLKKKALLGKKISVESASKTDSINQTDAAPKMDDSVSVTTKADALGYPIPDFAAVQMANPHNELPTVGSEMKAAVEDAKSASPDNMRYGPKRFLTTSELQERDSGHIDDIPKKRPNASQPDAISRNPLTGEGCLSDDMRPDFFTKLREGNPVLGVGYKGEKKSNRFHSGKF